jgi:hypothetical protein
MLSLSAPVTRFALYVLLLALAVSPLAAQSGSAQPGLADPIFSQVPFDQWLSGSDQSRMHWNVRVSEPELSPHQRLSAHVDVEVDGAELVRRRGKGQFLVLVQVNDEKGTAWQSHEEMDLEHVEDGMKASNLVFSHFFFVLPGDYSISIAIFATATAEHSVLKRKLHVSPLKNDPLPGALRDLPAVEIVRPEMPPDSWYLPAMRGKLRLAVETHEPVHVDLVVNLTPSERLAGSNRIQNRNLELLLPTTKVLSQVDWGDATFNLAWLDLSRRRVLYQQDNMHGLDWSKAAGSLAELNPGTIDVKSLEKRQFTAEFFLDEIRRRIGEAKGPAPRRTPVVIVLSSAVGFESGQEVHPIALDGATNARVFYIRYQAPPQITLGQPAAPVGRQRRRIQDGTLPVRVNSVTPADRLEPLLKPLEPRLFDVTTTEQFRKALATILAEIAKL